MLLKKSKARSLQDRICERTATEFRLQQPRHMRERRTARARRSSTRGGRRKTDPRVSDLETAKRQWEATAPPAQEKPKSELSTNARDGSSHTDD